MAKNIFSGFTDAFKGVGRAIEMGQKRALNKAARSTKTFISKTTRGEVGLKSKDINKRLLLNKTQTGFNKPFSFKSGVGIATKQGHALRLFSPKQKKINVGKKALFGKYRYGVTVKLSKGGREFVPKAFLMTVRGNQIVAARKGQARKPTQELFTKIFINSVMNNVKKYKNYMTKEFKRLVGKEVTYAVDQRLTKNDNEE